MPPRVGMLRAVLSEVLLSGVRLTDSDLLSSVQGRTAKALRSLQFTNPGKQTEFAPESGKREKRKLTKNSSAGSDR